MATPSSLSITPPPAPPQPAPEPIVVGRKNSHLMRAQFLDEATKVVPNSALLINMVSRRVRQLALGHRPLIEVTPRMTFMDIALKEIADKKLAFESVSEGDAAL